MSLNGVDLASAPLSWVRAQSAVVEQTTYLFSGTLRDNLLLASPAATDDQLIEALRAAHLGEFFESLPGGLDARVVPEAWPCPAVRPSASRSPAHS